MVDYFGQIAAKKLSYYLKDRITKERFAAFSFVLDDSVTEEEILQMEEAVNEAPFSDVLCLNMTKNNAAARTLLELAFFSYRCSFAEEIFGYIIPGHGKDVSIRLAVMVLGWEPETVCKSAAEACMMMDKILLQKTLEEETMDIRFCADFTLLSLLQGHYMPSPDMENYVLFKPKEDTAEEMIFWEADAERISGSIARIPAAVCAVYGEKFSGRRFFAAYTAKKCGLGLYEVDFAYFTDAQGHSELELRIRHAVRDCFLLGSALCISNITKNSMSHEAEGIRIISRILERFSFCAYPVFLTAETDISLIPYLKQTCFCFAIPKLNAAQSLKTWEYFASRLPGFPYECYKNVAERIILPVGKIKQAVIRCSLEENKWDAFRLAEICYEYIDAEQYKGIRRIYPKYHWEDIKLAAAQKNMLEQICSHAAWKETILGQWDMRKHYAYGNSISALFAGAPGTGKTMAAHAIADRLHLALYQADLSQILDKYIGETEKRLSEIFDMAEKASAILFLDEADALLGKRSEIQSSHDRYGNNATAYILQRMEEFDGIILMATNFSNNIDQAFLRRIRYVVNFTMPDREIRRQIWSSFFNSSMPHEEIDFEFLSSDDFEFSGAAIKNIMMYAMVRAAAEQKPLGMSHIVCGMKEEYRKMGIHAVKNKWKQYETVS